MNEADTCRILVTPKLQEAGWDIEPARIAEQVTFTDGRIIVVGQKARRRNGKRADYVLRFRPDMPLAVVEAKPDTSPVGEGMQQAKEYAQILGLSFAYATNGNEIVEYDYMTGVETALTAYPSPEELWGRLQKNNPIPARAAEHLFTPAYHLSGKTPRYYQEIAINRAVEAVLHGRKRILLTMATGTGKTLVAFQICWKLWSSRWNREGAYRRPRILYLSDRNILIDDPKDKTFGPFGDARWKIENGVANKSREMYFAIYQSIARDERRPGLYKEYAPGFFDLVIVDECHRGSANEESNWREILDHFEPAFQIGMTATPLRQDNRDTYQYFGSPLYTYSLRQGIDDGFLAPYRVHRVISQWDAAGWRPSQGDLDRYGREIPDEEYQTADFERVVALRARTEAVARHLTRFLTETDRYGKTLVFCVDQEHADEMRHAITNLNADLMQRHSDYVCRVTSDEGGIGLGHLSRFQDVESDTPVILTTSKLLTTGVDAPTVKNVALVRVINSMTEFKQIIGRGTRVRDDYGKYFFNIIDYTGSATRLFADPEFDGEPIDVVEERSESPPTAESPRKSSEADIEHGNSPVSAADLSAAPRRKFYFDAGQVEIVAHLVYELDPDGNQLRVVRFTDYTGEKVRSMYNNAAELRHHWADPKERRSIIERLAERGIDFDGLAIAAEQPDADPFDLLCHLAFNAPLRTRRERAGRLRSERKDFFEQYSSDARQILEELLDKYAEHGVAQFLLPDVLEVPPLNRHGNIMEIAGLFGGPDALRSAVTEMQSLLYAA